MTRLYSWRTRKNAEHVETGGGGEAYISLSCLACCGQLCPHQLSTCSPAASHFAVQSWPVCWRITWADVFTASSPSARHPALSEDPHLSIPRERRGGVIKRWRGLEYGYEWDWSGLVGGWRLLIQFEMLFHLQAGDVHMDMLASSKRPNPGCL